jgi:hypothetical protein
VLGEYSWAEPIKDALTKRMAGIIIEPALFAGDNDEDEDD